MSCLGLEDSVKIIKQNRSWNLVWKNLLANVQDNNIKYLTHAGWVTFLAMLIEIDKTGPVLSGLDPQAWENAIEILHQLAELLNPIDEIKEDLRGDLKNEFEFPFEGMQNIYETWTPEKLQWISKQLNGLDEILDVKVELLDTQYFQMKVAKRDIIIHIDAEEYSKPLYFVTYSKKTSNGLDSFEISPADESKFRLSCTKKQNKILGISLIAKEFGERLSSWENSQTETASCVSNSNEDKPEKVVEERKRTDTAREACAEVEVTTIEKRVHNDDEEENNDLKNRIEWMHNGNWNKRKKAFKELDRIALFQFRIDSSYLPPEFEVEEDGKTMPDNLDSFSYAEYRRRQLLEPVLDACDKFDVEILLLPEYSVRPETVEWMCECLQEKKYTFSIWAGTFKIPAGYQFKTDYWREPKKETLNKRIYYHSAPLPVIMNDSNEDGSRNVCIIAKKVKKYPAVALQEEINPVPAINTAKGQESFRPIVDLVRDFPGIDINDDARKDVTELICAETFAVSNIVNYPSFFQISKETYRKYEKYSKIDETYEKSMVEDIMNPKLFTPKAK